MPSNTKNRSFSTTGVFCLSVCAGGGQRSEEKHRQSTIGCLSCEAFLKFNFHFFLRNDPAFFDIFDALIYFFTNKKMIMNVIEGRILRKNVEYILRLFFNGLH